MCLMLLQCFLEGETLANLALKWDNQMVLPVHNLISFPPPVFGKPFTSMAAMGLRNRCLCVCWKLQMGRS